MDSNELSSAPAPASAGQKYQKVKNSNPWGWQFYCPERNFSQGSVRSRSRVSRGHWQCRRWSGSCHGDPSHYPPPRMFLCPQDWFLDCLEILRVSHKMLVWTLTKVGAGNIIRAGSGRAGPPSPGRAAHVSTCPGSPGRLGVSLTDPHRQHGWTLPASLTQTSSLSQIRPKRCLEFETNNQ